MEDHPFVIIACAGFAVFALIGMMQCDIVKTREQEQTNRLYIERGYCRDGWGLWKPCR